MNWSIWKFQAAPPLASWAEVHGRKSLSLSKKLSSGSGYSLLVFIPRINRYQLRIFKKMDSLLYASVYKDLIKWR